MRKPSKERIRAQKECNEQIRKKIIKPTPVRINKLRERKQVVQHVCNTEGGSDSDKTIVYDTPPKTVAKPAKKCGKAKFVIRTVGIKVHKDVDAETAHKYSRICTFQCPLCGSKHQSTRGLNLHFKTTHDVLHCKECGKGFQSLLSLKKHTYIHSDCKHVCNTCDRRFPFRSQLVSHMISHNNSDHFKCDSKNCESSFECESDLKLHLQVHDATPIKCSHCAYENKDIRNVRQHEQVHDDTKPYRCGKCGKRFKFAMQRIRHQKNDCK